MEGERLGPGSICPVCKLGQMDYDGLLNLSCPGCGHTLVDGRFT